MRHLVAVVLIYLAFVGHIGLRFGVTRDWAPNLMLLVVLLAVPRSTQNVWAALVGLLVDASAGRPLGVTMLVVTLVVTILLHVQQPQAGRDRRAGSFVGVFLAVLAVESLSRLLAGTVVNGVDYGAEVTVSLKIATSSFLIVFVMHFVFVMMRGLWRAAVSRPERPLVTGLNAPRALRG